MKDKSRVEYVDDEEIDDIYNLKKELEVRPERKDIEHIREQIKKEIEISRRAMPRMVEEHVKPLKRESPAIMGSLFDREKFLGERIKETQESIETRKKLHEEMIADIDSDIEEKEKMHFQVGDLDERRNLKLDISILRKEKRLESLQFWRDLLELKTELRKLMEEHESEKKIVGIFKDLEGDGNAN